MSDEQRQDSQWADGCLWANVLIIVIPVLLLIIAFIILATAWR